MTAELLAAASEIARRELIQGPNNAYPDERYYSVGEDGVPVHRPWKGEPMRTNFELIRTPTQLHAPAHKNGFYMAMQNKEE